MLRKIYGMAPPRYWRWLLQGVVYLVLAAFLLLIIYDYRVSDEAPKSPDPAPSEAGQSAAPRADVGGPPSVGYFDPIFRAVNYPLEKLGYGPVFDDAGLVTLRGIFSYAGEAIVAIFAIFFIYLDYNSRLAIIRRDKSKNAQTARSWVFYNVTNRIAQDVAAFSQLRGMVGEWFMAEPSGSEKTDVPIEDLEGPDVLVLHGILQGYSNSWGNDDVLSRALDFDFVLLGQTEKEFILRYFERYNELEDEVSRLASLCALYSEALEKDTARSHYSGAPQIRESNSTGDSEPASMAEQVLEKIKPELAAKLSKLRGSLISIVENALVLSVIVDFSDVSANFAKDRKIALDHVKNCFPATGENMMRTESDVSSRDPELKVVKWPWDLDPYRLNKSQKKIRWWATLEHQKGDEDAPNADARLVFPRERDASRILELLVERLVKVELLEERQVRRIGQYRRGFDTTKLPPK